MALHGEDMCDPECVLTHRNKINYLECNGLAWLIQENRLQENKLLEVGEPNLDNPGSNTRKINYPEWVSLTWIIQELTPAPLQVIQSAGIRVSCPNHLF